MSPLITAMILGLMQGILEWLPISSQGNLVVLSIAILGLEPAHALSLSVLLHIGTGLAAFVYFRNEVFKILQRGTEEDRSLFRFLAISTVTTGLVGVPLFIFVKTATYMGEALLALTGAALIATGIIQRKSGHEGAQTSETLDAGDGLALGVVQGFSALPGLSRSGLTTSALLFKRFPGKEAFRVSFLMSIPAAFAATAGLALIGGVPQIDASILVALLASFLSAIVSIDFFIKLAKRTRFWKLCILLGLIALVAVLPYLF
ncbi:MAG: undecaprenyl-diphosphate phosphatase [Candidatus Bathyarchaeota archaeon]|nr:MAG: undecaprenyl-diphosphate phosphatase [Candidatus Bathyarchaeota archaeon]